MADKNSVFVNNSAPSVDDTWLNMTQDERDNIITAGGLTPTVSTNDQVVDAITNIVANADYYTDGGAADAYVLSVISPNVAPDRFRNGMRVRFRTANANTGASTVNVAGLGVKNIKKQNGSSDPDAADISLARENVIVYDGTNFRLTTELNDATTTVKGITEYATAGEINANTSTKSMNAFEFSESNKGAWTLIETQTASTSATIEFNDLDGTYKEYRFEGISVIPETDNTRLYMQVSTNNGVGWITTNTYYFDWDGESQAGATTNNGDGVAQIEIYDQLGNTSGEFLDFTMTTKDLANAGRQKAFKYDSIYVDINGATGAGNTNNGQGHYLANTAVNAVKFYMSGDAILSGTFKLYGIK